MEKAICFFLSPSFDVRVSGFSRFTSQRHINAVDSYLKLRQKDASLAKLRLHLHLNDVESRSLIDSWIDVALERKVKELDLFTLPRGRARGKPYSLPAKIFAATTITVLSLRRVILEICGDIDLPALRKLYLGEIRCDEQPIQKLISSCPLIDCLHIESCHGLQKLHVSGLANLRRLERVNILVLICSKIVSGLPNLEGLGIRCTQLQRIEISHHQLKRLDLSLTEKQSKAKLKIDTPNLQSFNSYITSSTTKEHPKCCTTCTTKCWRHYLEDVQIDGDESRLEINGITAMPELSTFMNCEVRFRLKWRSQLLYNIRLLYTLYTN
ncbi:hypothetical protein CK203_038201 [Vitis vinifera]|uniref:F-box/LRR-repeat protein 15/At3g58940/PEG3-like LRR domain-containing protein n=1 Tax=Vitis vinifera TaxID=29760 RepID=A0A438IBQ3_VITVI|nr:hypothetical protein CK203_038201 [Vitis vinifera]